MAGTFYLEHCAVVAGPNNPDVPCVLPHVNELVRTAPRANAQTRLHSVLIHTLRATRIAGDQTVDAFGR
eukprot:2574926-Lingulodinium_polyedra.AAC.1